MQYYLPVTVFPRISGDPLTPDWPQKYSEFRRFPLHGFDFYRVFEPSIVTFLLLIILPFYNES